MVRPEDAISSTRTGWQPRKPDKFGISIRTSRSPDRCFAKTTCGAPAARATSVTEINAMMKAAAAGPLKGVLAYTEEPLVSIDYNHDPHSSTFDGTMTKVIEGTLVKVCSWYDNEWGFSNRMLDTTVAWSKAR